ncbi:peptidylprolyl isomerase [Floricoccus penangensis]|uniref:peptidylprolyl isomerase n=1 Tax=Floricoccus penangensis TaxID=1859475 RepID=UPI00203F55B2|nr:peptidylprolyl isomerase [Floricoccus penangensis]URZ87992.1 peptidyl-prolyl cis-trans isomerase [Floricoccus penangensis]
MNFKKITLTAATALAMVSLAACGQKDSSTNTDIVTMKGNTIRVTDFYNAAKNNTSANGTQIVQQLVLDDVLEDKYKGKVSDKEVNAEYDKTKKQYGDQFSAALAQAGLTEESYKSSIKTNLLVKYAVDQAVKKEYTDANMKAAWDKFHPEVTARVIQVSDEKTAKEVLEEVKKDDSKFGDIAKEKSVGPDKDKGGEIKFDSNSNELPAEVKDAAFKLEDGKVSDIITVSNQTGASSYYIVKMEKNSKKGNDMNKYKGDLEKAIKNEKESDSKFTTGVIGNLLKEYNVTIKEKAFSNALSQYTTDATDTSKK